MASTYSPLLGIELIGIGDQNNTWGTTNNSNLGTLIEQAIAGTATADVSAGNVTLTDYDGASDQARCAILKVTGTPGTTRSIIAPARSKVYIVANGSDGAILLKTSTSTGVTIRAGAVEVAYFDTSTLDYATVSYPASSANVSETLVLRDSSGNFAAGAITATTFAGQLSGTIASATTATTQLTSDNSTKVATTAFVQTKVGTLGTMASQNSNSVAITGGTISGVSLAATNITNPGGWSITPTGTTLYFNYDGFNVAKLDAVGNLTVIGNVTAYGSV